jgi:hypothetical protein
VSLLELLVSLAPLLAIALVLLLGRYPGERALRRRLGRRRGRPRGAGAAPVPLRHLRTRLPRGGALLAYALAGRAPPPGTA